LSALADGSSLSAAFCHRWRPLLFSTADISTTASAKFSAHIKASWRASFSRLALPPDLELVGVAWGDRYVLLPVQLQFRFLSLARWAIAAWLALLACLPLLILAILIEARRLARQSKPEVAPVARIP